jgi:serine/threonine protein kinase
MDNKHTKSIVGGVENEGAFSSEISSVKGHTSVVVHAPSQNEQFKADTHNLSRSSSEEGSTTNLGSNSSEDVASSVVALEYTSHNTETVPVMDNKATKSIVGGVGNEGVFSSHISSVKGHTSVVVHAPGQNEDLKADTHNLSSSSSEEGSPTNLGNNSWGEEVASSVVALEYTSHSTGTVPVMDNKDTKRIVGGVENEGAFSSHICSVKEHSSAVVHASGQNEELKADTHNLNSNSSKEGSTTNLGSSSEEEEEEVASSVLAPLYSASAPESLWSEVRPCDSSGAETENEEENFHLVRRIHPSELEIVRKIAEGGQAKIFLALWLKTQAVIVKRYNDPNVSVVDLQRQMERVMMKACAGTSESGLCKVIGVSRDKNGKALLVMERMQGDLRNLIDSKRIFSHSDKRDIMRGIARGLKNLHACGRTHKDVKASNILVSLRESITQRLPRGRYPKFDPHFPRFDGWLMLPGVGEFEGWPMRPAVDEFDSWAKRPRGEGAPFSRQELKKLSSYSREERVNAYIGDYESVDGVFGTRFWRAPEVLKALKYGSPEDLKLAYSPAVDVYGFGMVLYELLTGRIPFDDHSLDDYDFVISGHRPDIPDDVSPKMRDLLLRCWHQDPHQRPNWTEIEKYF